MMPLPFRCSSSLLLTTCLATTLLSCGTQSPPAANNSPSAIASPVQTTPPQPTPAQKSETTRNVETKLQEMLSADLPTPVKSVACPDGITIAAGKRYSCTGVLDVGQFTIKIDIKDESGKFQLQTEGLLLLAKVEDLFEQNIKRQTNITVKADCGGQVKLFKKVGEEFQCQLTTADGKKSPGQVKVTDLEGVVDVSWKLNS